MFRLIIQTLSLTHIPTDFKLDVFWIVAGLDQKAILDIVCGLIMRDLGQETDIMRMIKTFYIRCMQQEEN